MFGEDLGAPRCAGRAAGNGAEVGEWEASGSFDADLLSPEQRALYEEKKLKMRKASGDIPGHIPAFAHRRAGMSLHAVHVWLPTWL